VPLALAWLGSSLRKPMREPRLETIGNDGDAAISAPKEKNKEDLKLNRGV